MEFEEVNNYIKTASNRNSFVDADQQATSTNPYSVALLQSHSVTRKPTLSNFVHRLKQQSSKTRFVREYKKKVVSDRVAVSDDDSIDDDASIRIIDPTRQQRDTTSEEEEEEEEEEYEESSDDNYLSSQEVLNLGIGSRTLEKKPLVKKVKINESANQIQGEEVLHPLQEGSFASNEERYITVDAAITLINKDISDKNDEIMKQMKRIEINKDEITKYKQDLLNMQKQLDFFHYSLTSLKADHIPDMLTHQLNATKNTEKLRENKKKNVLLKSRFDRYRKAISLDTRLFELEKKINAAWRRDEIWAGIRDWGFLSVLIVSLVIASFIAWKAG